MGKKLTKKNEISNKIDDLELVDLHFTSSNGTDLNIGLTSKSKFGYRGPLPPNYIRNMANFPTEEICTTPHKYKINGNKVTDFYGRTLFVLEGEKVKDFYGRVVLNISYDQVKDFYGKTIARFDTSYIKNFYGSIEYRLDGFFSRREIMAILAVLYAV